jgi:NitT/TauT family transport system substrate-binding protein
LPRHDNPWVEAPVGGLLSRRLILAGLLGVLLPAKASAVEAVRFGILNSGTALWETDVIRRHGLDLERGFQLSPIQFASGEAAKVALHAGAVDIIVSDLLWAARQRAEGEALCVLPYSRALGALELHPGSTVRSLGDLKGKRLGVAGGALDKSWLILRAVSIKELGEDLVDLVEPVFGAPPLIVHEFAKGRLDAALIFWNFAAQLEADGARPLITVSEMISRLGLSADVPLLGYIFHEEWARNNPRLLAGFARASRAAKMMLASSDEEWRQLGALLGTDRPDVRIRLRDAYRHGIPKAGPLAEKEGAAQLFSTLVELGGERLVGNARSLDPALFWNAVEL